jgi:hypothetical protein
MGNSNRINFHDGECYYQHYHMAFLPVFVVGSQYKETWRIVLRAYLFRYYDLNQPYPVLHTISDTLETIPFCYRFMENFPHHKAEPQKNVPNHCWAQEYEFFEDHQYDAMEAHLNISKMV